MLHLDVRHDIEFPWYEPVSTTSQSLEGLTLMGLDEQVDEEPISYHADSLELLTSLLESFGLCLDRASL